MSFRPRTMRVLPSIKKMYTIEEKDRVLPRLHRNYDVGKGLIRCPRIALGSSTLSSYGV